ncbi:hypothetical protein FACS1894139_03100 [Planctomycetales bacterium]|nr:hypothetical protein FACS1894107_08340 [Planctomycetales bacterium]GHT00502.1 hypothetical protein FACS1894108_12720 [Planctomycetales bacterium]GHT03258.1 hypothetical protein FACS1894139_03100 [Planctomycetales bacterium]
MFSKEEDIRALFEEAMNDFGVIAATEFVLKNDGEALNEKTINLEPVKKSLTIQQSFYKKIYSQNAGGNCYA